MWEGNIKFDPINDVWFFSFIFSGFVLLVIIASSIWHVLFEAPFGTAWAEIFKMITMAMNPPPKSGPKVSEEKKCPIADEGKAENKIEETTELETRNDVEIEAEKQPTTQAAAEL